jgi:hypothetical protein
MHSFFELYKDFGSTSEIRSGEASSTTRDSVVGTTTIKKHVYEIIRENYPCRAYFDLEFSTEDNPELDGDAITAMWCNLVVWKVHSLFGIALGPQNVVVLDCSTEVKFSKHMTLLIPRDGHHYAPAAPTSATSWNQNGELLFRNNLAVGAFVESILQDITEITVIPLPHNGDNGTPASAANIAPPLGTRVCRRPRPEYESLWVKKKDGKRTCFVDLGVYTKNRAFRLFGSSKFGKHAIFQWSGVDRKLYTGLKGGGIFGAGSGSGLSQRQQKVVPLSPNRLKHQYLELSAVVPYDLIDRYRSTFSQFCRETSSNSSDQSANSSSESLSSTLSSPSPSSSSSSSSSPQMIKSLADSFDYADSFLDVNLPAPSRDISFHPHSTRDYSSSSISAVTAGGIAETDEYSGTQVNVGRYSQRRNNGEQWRSIMEIASSTHQRQSSPFPSIDSFVLFIASKGGVQGYISSWSLYAANQTYRVRYTIGKNRWCEKVGRPHKSNGIILEVDLNFLVLTQTCFDPDCRGFRWEPIPLPPQCLSSISGGSAALQETCEDLLLQRSLTENPDEWE